MTPQEKAVKYLEQLDIYKPYIDKFKKDGTVTMFEGYGAGYYMDENAGFDDKEAIDEMKEIEEKYDVLVYACVHNLSSFGELYAYLFVSKSPSEEDEENEEDGYGELMPFEGNEFSAMSFVWNKTDPWLSDMGDIGVKPNAGGLVRTW